MSFLDRILNLLRGFASIFVTGIEVNNPEVVYEAAINQRIAQHDKFKEAVARIVSLRNKLTRDLEIKSAKLREVLPQLDAAVAADDDEVALILLEQKNELEPAIATVKAELDRISKQAEEAKDGLLAFRSEIEKLKREKDEMLAKKATAEAQIKIQEQLDGLSTDADIKQLENVREHIGQLQAQADVGAEIHGSSLDARLKKIREKAGSHVAKSQLDELKKMRAAQSAAGAVQRTM